MNRAFSTEYYPDMKVNDFGQKVVTLSCRVNNGKRFKALTQDERQYLASTIELFQKQLDGFKADVLAAQTRPFKKV
jgi:hypothetical protein